MSVNGADFHKWVNTVVIGACGGLIAALWFMLQSQITAVSLQIADLRIDVRVLQTQVIEQKGAVKALEQRVQDLVDTFNKGGKR